MTASNDFRRQRLSDFLAAQVEATAGQRRRHQKTSVGSGSTTPPGSAEPSRLGANENDTPARIICDHAQTPPDYQTRRELS